MNGDVLSNIQCVTIINNKFWSKVVSDFPVLGVCDFNTTDTSIIDCVGIGKIIEKLALSSFVERDNIDFKLKKH